ncbi:unnamed protein product [Rotaria magnacalcarata]
MQASSSTILPIVEPHKLIAYKFIGGGGSSLYVCLLHYIYHCKTLILIALSTLTSSVHTYYRRRLYPHNNIKYK